MLDQIQSKKIWNKLVEQNYPIEKITISVDNFSYIEIIFEKNSDLEKFRELIFSLMYVDISPICNSSQLSLFVKIDLDFLNKIIYPKFTEQIHIYNSIETENAINLGILPQELKKLIIISSDPFDLTNLPNQLVFLDLSGCTGWKKFNLDYLPESLKILKLAYTDDLGGQTIYGIKDFQNLPSSLNEIFIGNMFFNSFEELIKNYQIKKPFLRK